jgi:hypothetical protein
MTVPAFLDPDWKRQMAGAKETGQALDEAAQSGVLSRKLAEKVAENFPNEADRERFMAKVEDRISGNARRGNPDVKVREMLTGRDEPDQER